MPKTDNFQPTEALSEHNKHTNERTQLYGVVMRSFVFLRQPLWREGIMVWINMAVNNEYGSLSGHCDGISIHYQDDLALSFDPHIVDRNFAGARIRFGKKRGEDTRTDMSFKLCGEWFPCARGRNYVGNICWNAYGLSGVDFLRLMKAIKRTDLYRPDSGWTEWWDWFDALNEHTTQPPWAGEVAARLTTNDA